MTRNQDRNRRIASSGSGASDSMTARTQSMEARTLSASAKGSGELTPWKRQRRYDEIASAAIERSALTGAVGR